MNTIIFFVAFYAIRYLIREYYPSNNALQIKSVEYISYSGLHSGVTEYRDKLIAKRDAQLGKDDKNVMHPIQMIVPPYVLPKHKLIYIVNDKPLLCSHSRYYYLLLKMPLPILRIDYDVVKRQYQRLINDGDMQPKKFQDIEAAKSYLTDRMDYLNFLN